MDEMGEIHSKHGEDQNCKHNFGWKTSRKETTWKTQAQMK